jgi:hypothetical protein
MISLDDISELVTELETGNLEREHFYSLCMDLFEYHEVETVLASLPVDLRRGLIADITTLFDNDVPAEDFLLLSSARGDHPAKIVIIDRIRRWLKARNER